MKKYSLCLLMVFLLCFSFKVLSATAVENRIDTRQVSQPFLPHRASTSTGEKINHDHYDNAEVCGSCHTEIYEEWRSSIMANAWEDPLYRALLREASIATEGAVDNFCTGCHTPLGLLSGRINSSVNRQLPHEGEEEVQLPGVDCEACHNMTQVSGLENGAYVMHSVTPGEAIKLGPRKDAVSPYHATEYSALHTKSEFCGTCHNVSHPFNQVPIERTYDEWYESEYRVSGVECQDCHMKAVQGRAAIMGPERKDRVSHHFASANTTIMQYFGDLDNVNRAREFLASAAELSVRHVSDASVGEVMQIELRVENTGAGHKLPTGFPEGREVWVDFSVTDANGREVYRSGKIEKGKTESGTRNFKVHMGDKYGNVIDVEVWKIERVLSDNRLLPKGYADVVYEYRVPAWAKTPLNVRAELKYWPFSQAMADRLLGKNTLTVSVETLAGLERKVALRPVNVSKTETVAIH